MSKTKTSWKVYQQSQNEFILLSDSDNIKKVKGNSANDIISVLLNHQAKSIDSTLDSNYTSIDLSKDYIESIEAWLEQNQLIDTLDYDKEIQNINVIANFGGQPQSSTPLKSKLGDYNINLKNAYDISNLTSIDNSLFTVVIGPLYYDSDVIDTISDFQRNLNNDILYIELYNNGISLGPLMNPKKGTVCLKCIESRRVFNASNPELIIENLQDTNSYNQITSGNIIDIGNIEINFSFIANELHKVLNLNNKRLYNRSVFIDFLEYENNSHVVTKSPICTNCSKHNSIYSPI